MLCGAVEIVLGVFERQQVGAVPHGVPQGQGAAQQKGTGGTHVLQAGPGGQGAHLHSHMATIMVIINGAVPGPGAALMQP